MSHYRRDVVGRGISTGLGLGLRRRLSGGALPVLFGWNPETAQALPATATFTRASVAQVLATTDGTTNWYQEAKSGELRLDGLRRAENLLDSSTGSGPFTAVAKDGRLAVSVIADTGTLTITIGGTPQVFTPTGTPQRFVAFDDATGGSTTVAISGTATLSEPMAHLCQVGSDVPEPYVQHDAEFLNIGVNGVTYFNTANTSTVDGSGVVTEATGTTITGGGYLPEPAATNQIDDNDLSGAGWASSGITETDNGVNSIGLHEYELDDGVGVGVVHRTRNDAVSAAANSCAYIVVKAGTGRYIIIQKGTDYTVYDLTSIAVTEQTGGVVEATITLVSDGYYKCFIQNASSNATFRISLSDTGTPGVANPAYDGSNRTYLVCHEQWENTAFSTSPIITSGSTATRVADTLFDNNIVIPLDATWNLDVTVPINPSASPGEVNPLGFNGGNRFTINDFPSAIFTPGPSANITALSSYAEERHLFKASSTTNTAQVLDDEGVFSTASGGISYTGATLYIGSQSSGVGHFRGLIHFVELLDGYTDLTP